MESDTVEFNYEEQFLPPFNENEATNFEVSKEEKGALETLVSLLIRHNLNQPETFSKTATRLCPILIPKLTRKIQKLTAPDLDLLFIKNLPTFEDEQGTKALSMLIACILGHPFQFLQQNHGEIVARISPELGLENTSSSSGRKKFGWHSDDSFLDERFRPDFLLLSGRYNPSQVRTFVSSLESIQKAMDPDLFFELMKPNFNIGLPASFRLDLGAQITKSPLVWFDGSRKTNLALSEYNATATCERGRVAIAALLDATEQCSTSYNLQPGNLIVFKNNRVLHARGQICGERTIFRVYIKSNISHLAKLNDEPTQIFDLNTILKEMKF